MKPEIQQRTEIPRDQLKIGDLVSYTAYGGPAWPDVKVMGLLHGRGGRLIGFFPAAGATIDPHVAVEIEQISQAWRVTTARGR
jgi:hypothetical protein